ncbi:hypothetical protein BH23ACT5_BH23ACT5_02740 [soil metagenome]
MQQWRRFGLPSVLWVYGLATTVFLFSIWGRSVVIDHQLLSDAAARAGQSEVVANRVESWFSSALSDLGVGEESGAIGAQIASLPEVGSATSTLVREVVLAVAETSPGRVVVDVAGIYAPTVPAIASSLASVGIPAEESQVSAVVSDLDPLVLRSNPGPPLIGPRSASARSLTLATLVALAVMVASGVTAIRSAEDRRLMVKSLLTRLAVSGLTFAAFFRVSAGVLDPGGGRATVGGGMAPVVGSNLWLPVTVAAVAGTGRWVAHHRPGGERRQTAT